MLVGAASSLAALTGPLVHRVLLAVVVLDIPFRLENNIAYRPEAARFGALGGFNVSVTTIALACLYLRWALLSVTVPLPESPRLSARGSWPLVSYLTFAALSTLVARDVGLALRELFLLAQVLLLYLYIVNRTTVDDVRWVLSMLLVAVLFESVAMLYGARAGQTEIIPGRAIRVDERDNLRVGGTIGSPNAAAAYLTLLVAPALAMLLTSARARLKAVAVLSAGLATVALVFTQSRGGWVATVVSLVLLWLASARSVRRPLLVPLAGACLVAAVVAFAGDTIATRLTADDKSSAESRWPLMRTAMLMIRDHPIIGVGPNNYGEVMKDYGAIEGDGGQFTYTVHNKFLLVWAETGPGGLLSFVWFLAATIRLGWRGWKARHPWLSPVALGFTCALVGHVLHMQVDLFNDRPQVEMLWLVSALLGVIAFSAPRAADSLGDRRSLGISVGTASW